MTRGEFFDKISEIVTEKEAWDIILGSDDFRKEMEIEENYLEENWLCPSKREFEDEILSIEAEKIIEWKESGISSYEGFFKRKNGRVELEE